MENALGIYVATTTDDKAFVVLHSGFGECAFKRVGDGEFLRSTLEEPIEISKILAKDILKIEL